ncbi:MAG TPA: molybdopterin molybdotransferase MoeA [Thermodesulfobacteriaceae bacterium]|nr:molybdopterin molybdotransferase MoeA [Thermodesulfobacteriaceae bacterium]
MEFFFQVKKVEEVLSAIEKFSPLGKENVDLTSAQGRFCAEDLISPEDLPPFSRSTMDGYAVYARDTFGAREGEPVVLRLVGEIPMGVEPTFSLSSGEAAKIATGGMLPEGADAVVMLEYAEEIGELVEIRRPVAPGENVITKGEDVPKGGLILAAHTRITPGHIGLLASAGITSIPVFKRPKVAIISTGDELVPPEAPLEPGKIRDANSFSLCAAVQEAGGTAHIMGIVPDQEEALYSTLQKALMENDVVLISGGSSVGTRDYTLRCISRLPDAELICHGVAVKPGKPTILARTGNKAVFGLPGQVTSALVVFYIMVRPLLLHLQGACGKDLFLPKVRAKALRNIASAQGREDYIRVKLQEDKEGKLWAEPIFGRSGILSPMAQADGLLHIPSESEGIYEGEEAEIFLL